MSNVIGGGPQNYSNVNLQQVRQKNILKSAYQRGDVGRLGKKETRKSEENDLVDMKGVKNYRKLPDGKSVTEFEDGTVRTEAPNGSFKEVDPDGNMSFSLPNNMTIEHKKDGEPKVYDQSTGQYMPAQMQKDKVTSSIYYAFKDAVGNRWKADPNSLGFEVQNHSESLTQKVNPDGSMNINSKTLSRDPDTGRFSQDKVMLRISADGKVTEESPTVGNVALNNKHLNFTARKDINVGINLPYSIPGKIEGDCVKPDLPPPTQEPQFPPPQEGMPPHHGGGTCPHPGYPGTIPQDPWQQFPWPNYPMPGPMPPQPGQPGQAPANDPYSPVMTPSGLMRKSEPDGSMFISLPNGIVMNQMPDGKCQAFDSRYPGKTLPVTSTTVNNPGYGPETRFTFQDGAGNIVNLYSQSLDFQYSSRDGNVIQNVSSNGNMLINAKTYPTGPDGNPQVRNHKVLITADGRVNTFGERGIQVNNKNIVFAEGGNITNYALPYEIPLEQGLMPYIPPAGYHPPGQIPVPDPSMPCPCPEQPGQMPGAPGEPTFPPGQETGEAGKDSAAAGKETPAEKPVKPGMWQRIKNFFTGDSGESGKAGKGKHHGWKDRFCGRGCNPYPCGYYDPYGGMITGMATGAMMGMLGTAMLTSMMYPMGVFYSPFGMFGMYGMW